ncbi:MAG: ATP-binding cassette domain-containing protein [Pseudomonadota bacterium]
MTERLTLAINDKALLRGVNLTIDDPGITVIMGPNGAGKSLMLRVLHGLLLPTTGVVTWAGRPPDDDVRHRQAMVFQRPVLLRRSARANLRFAQDVVGERDDARTDALLDAVRLGDRAESPARKLSGGEQQRLSLARALATRPDVLFLDEATASLDPYSTRIIEEIVRETAGRGTKVIFVTHNLHQAERLADDVVFLSRGKVAEHTAASQFFAQPSSSAANAYVTGRLDED